MEKNTIVRTIEMSDEADVKSGEAKMTIEISSTHTPYDLTETSDIKVTDITEEEVQYALARLRAILTNRYLSNEEEIFVALTVSVRTKQ